MSKLQRASKSSECVVVLKPVAKAFYDCFVGKLSFLLDAKCYYIVSGEGLIKNVCSICALLSRNIDLNILVYLFN